MPCSAPKWCGTVLLDHGGTLGEVETEVLSSAVVTFSPAELEGELEALWWGVG